MSGISEIISLNKFRKVVTVYFVKKLYGII